MSDTQTNAEPPLAPALSEALEAAAKELLERLQKRVEEVLKPGDVIEPGRPSVQGTGSAEGVIYLTGRKGPGGIELLPDRFYEALRYVRPQDPIVLALNPEKRGRCQPEIWEILSTRRNEEIGRQISQLCEETGQEVKCTFTTNKRAIEATRKENLNRWVVVPATEGVWCVIYV